MSLTRISRYLPAPMIDISMLQGKVDDAAARTAGMSGVTGVELATGAAATVAPTKRLAAMMANRGLT
ncbi:hypothetical protein E1262_00830 [Jiangella aurantiaca]|uniref:Uncharacterized protein n=1 Tax=Jiangella aurantiaca TaxID=2530373 RepID=A0A4R5APT8_9ACTN|nr:hypothetical protein [Jiangella aurantiaca]TDD73064.1 hypothetical protein E1262_00830 [Jiangella aurantiaca]